MLRLTRRLLNGASLTGVSLAIMACSHVAPLITVDENGAPIAIPQQRDGQRVVVDLDHNRPAHFSWRHTHDWGAEGLGADLLRTSKSFESRGGLRL
jgi:hypothetical protein